MVRATNSQQREVDRFHKVNLKQATTDEKVSRYNSLMAPLGEIIAVTGAMLIVGLAYWFFVSTGKMRAPHLAGFGFILLRLLPLEPTPQHRQSLIETGLDGAQRAIEHVGDLLERQPVILLQHDRRALLFGQPLHCFGHRRAHLAS